MLWIPVYNRAAVRFDEHVWPGWVSGYLVALRPATSMTQPLAMSVDGAPQQTTSYQSSSDPELEPGSVEGLTEEFHAEALLLQQLHDQAAREFDLGFVAVEDLHSRILPWNG